MAVRKCARTECAYYTADIFRRRGNIETFIPVDGLGATQKMYTIKGRERERAQISNNNNFRHNRTELC